jgi:hypothetical protein
LEGCIYTDHDERKQNTVGGIHLAQYRPDGDSCASGKHSSFAKGRISLAIEASHGGFYSTEHSFYFHIPQVG